MIQVVLLVLLVLMPTAAAADLWQALEHPRAVALMRHALAPGTGDPPGFTLGDCATQRVLSDEGRAQAQAAGAALRARGVVFDAVFAGRWCRVRDTAVLMDVGAVQEALALDSFFADRAEGPARTTAARALIDATPGRLLLVTHQVNITALSGVTPASGEIVVLVPGPDGWQVAGRGRPEG
ncbi:MAG: histidine phosphatase family protein [Rhodobacteraceae bacterium]|jgi:phosphohistidine phosphatase SixA|nr:histidine phosphatase family protein [Paracoccaceae bacterium]